MVEVKHWTSNGDKPGRSVVKALVDIVASETTNTMGVILSSSGFTKNVLKGATEIERKKVKLGDQTKIVSLCQNYLQSSEGLWIPTTELADMLLDGTI